MLIVIHLPVGVILFIHLLVGLNLLMIFLLFYILLRVGLYLLMIFFLFVIGEILNKVLSKIGPRNRAEVQAKRHFVLGTQLLARAVSSKNCFDSTSRSSLVKEAQAEAEKAIALDPNGASAHFLKSQALELQGFKTSALDSLDAALSPLRVKSMSDPQRGVALFTRARLKVAIALRYRTDSAVADLEDAVTLRPENAKAFRLLGECYEGKKMKEEAKKAYEDALRVDPKLTAAREALDRLGS